MQRSTVPRPHSRASLHLPPHLPRFCLQILVLIIFFQQAINDAGLQAMGLFLAIIGLMAFLEGLRIAVMVRRGARLAPPAACCAPPRPYSHLPLACCSPWPKCWAPSSHASSRSFLCLWWPAGLLGILVTYAEPAIAALRPLARLVDPEQAPYLYYVMNSQVKKKGKGSRTAAAHSPRFRCRLHLLNAPRLRASLFRRADSVDNGLPSSVCR